MIYYCVTRAGHATISRYLATRGRALAPHVRIVVYEHLPFRRSVPTGTYVFADVERLTPGDAAQAAEAWAGLAGCKGVRLLNHPTRSMRRFELLRTLHDRGVNQANCYRVTDRRAPARFPVFVRHENDHGGSLTALLETPDALARELGRLEDAGVYRDDLLVVEFCATADAEGVVRKYSAFRVGDRIVPRHVLFGRQWQLKVVELSDPAYVREELAYVQANPHQKELLAVCDTARIEFGRVDYAIADGGIQVWEINTNPILGTFEDGGMPARAPVVALVNPAFADALRALDTSAGASRVRIGSLSSRARARLRSGLNGLLIALGLERWEVGLSSWLARVWRAVCGAR